MKSNGAWAESIPDGFEVYENPNSQVFLRKIAPALVTKEEVAVGQSHQSQALPRRSQGKRHHRPLAQPGPRLAGPSAFDHGPWRELPFDLREAVELRPHDAFRPA